MSKVSRPKRSAEVASTIDTTDEKRRSALDRQLRTSKSVFDTADTALDRRNKKYLHALKFLNLIFAICIFAQSANAVDASKFASDIKTFDDWRVVEFALPKGILYRMVTTSLTSKDIFLALAIGTVKNCEAGSAELIQMKQNYHKYFDEGFLPISYRMTGSKEQINNLARTHMSINDPGGTLFIELKSLNVDYFNSRPKG